MSRKNNRAANGATVGCEANLWRMADALCGSVDADRDGLDDYCALNSCEPLHEGKRQ